MSGADGRDGQLVMPREDKAILRSLAQAILAIARALFTEDHHRHIRLAFELPTSVRGNGTMANYQLKNDSVDTITIKGVNDATQQPEDLPAGDVLTAASNNPAVNASIGTDAAGAPALVINATVQAASSVTVTVTDSAGDKAVTLLVDVVADVVPEDLALDLTNVAHASQTIPPA